MTMPVSQVTPASPSPSVSSSSSSTVSASAPVIPFRAPPVPSTRAQALTMSVEVIGPAALSQRRAAWQELAHAAVEPNPFFEPWMLLPALEHLPSDGDIEIALVWGADPRPGQPPVLCGLVPLERVRRYRGLPVSARRLWHYRHCYSGTPLVRAGHVRATLAALLDWLALDGKSGLLELRSIPGEGEIHRHLTHLIKERSLETQVVDSFTRAVLRRASDADTYLRGAISGGRLKELRRLERRLAETGKVELAALAPGEDSGPWITELLELEARGWKGRVGTALAATPEDRAFFESIVRAAHGEGRAMMMALRLDGKALAMRCSFRAHDGAMAFKIAFDESYWRYSPGVLLELQNVRRVHATDGLRWMDSCAHWQHPMIDHVWSERTSLQTLLVATGKGRIASGLVAAFPLLRWLRKAALGRNRATTDAPGSRSALCASGVELPGGRQVTDDGARTAAVEKGTR